MQTKQLLKMFQSRDDLYHTCTEQIAEKLGYVFEAVIEALGIDRDTIAWEEMNIYERSLVLIAKIGSEQDPSYKLITVGIPLFVLEKESKDTLVKFLLANKSPETVDEQTELQYGYSQHQDNNQEEDPFSNLSGETITAPATPKDLRDLRESMKDYVVRGGTHKRTIH